MTLVRRVGVPREPQGGPRAPEPPTDERECSARVYAIARLDPIRAQLEDDMSEVFMFFEAKEVK